MTREDKRIEETNSAAEYFIAGPLCEEKFTKEQEDFVKYCFAEGVKWADENPQSPWISVKDDLPYKHEELILNKEHSFLTNKVLIKTKVRVHTAFMIKDIIIDKWIWYGYGEDENQITHWMSIPELPKE